MHPEIDELRPRLKEILYDCAVEIKATKAALYLLDTSVRKFELVAEFGFRSGVRSWAGYNDPMVDRCSRGRSPFFVNSVGAEPRLSDMMFETASERLLGVPTFSRGQLVMDRFGPAAGPDLRYAPPAEPVMAAYSATVNTARAAASALLTPPVSDVLTDAELVEVRDALRGILLLPGALLQNRLQGWLRVEIGD